MKTVQLKTEETFVSRTADERRRLLSDLLSAAGPQKKKGRAERPAGGSGGFAPHRP